MRPSFKKLISGFSTIVILAITMSILPSPAQADIGWCTIVPDECGVEGPGPTESGPDHTIGGMGFILRAFGNHHDWIDYVPTPPSQLATELVACMAEQMTEEERDILANEIANLIRTAPGWLYNEYGAIIWYDGTNYRRGTLTAGNSNSVALNFQEGQSNEIVAAIVHSHPLNSWSSPSAADWSVLSGQPTTPDGGANYILNYSDSTLYEYDASDTPRLSGSMDGTTENAIDAKGNCND